MNELPLIEAFRHELDELALHAATPAALDVAWRRERLVVFDLAALSNAGAVRSSVAVFLEWVLRDAYGVKILVPAAFTQGLVSRGVVSLGMG